MDKQMSLFAAPVQPMKFKITTVRYAYTEEEKKELEAIGIPFVPLAGDRYTGKEKWYRKAFEETIDDKFLPEISIGSLEELMQIVLKFGYVIIRPPNIIEIYDDDRE